ncbi:phytoene/squalene synthase family protein [Hoeflea marina]|uniref:phytoene/squalene synthase family protein n=1 Tax=Hoeflea marina TaxID=274592 RepID=UPI001FE0A524|nr:phytoene/squalene synthase family protein [Hoeflea marina]
MPHASAEAGISDWTRSLSALREADRDRYLSLLLMPESARADIAALYLFNAEVAAVRDRVRESLPGEIRLQWWRDVISGERAIEAVNHPVAASLLRSIATRQLPTAPLMALCDAHVFDLYDDPMPDRGSYEGYAGETAAAMIQLTSVVLDPAASSESAIAAGHAGVAHAVAGHLMLLPQHRARGQVFVPGDILAATGLDRDAFLAGDDRAAVAAALSAFVALGREHLGKARAAMAPLPPSLRAAFIPAAIAAPVLDRAGRLGADCLTRPPQPPQWLRQWRLWRVSRGGAL